MTEFSSPAVPVEFSADDGPLQFHIPAKTSLSEQRLRALKHGDTFGLFDHFGDIGYDPGVPEGIYHADTRYLSRLALHIDGVRPLLLSSVIGDDNVGMMVDLSNPDYHDAAGHLRLARDSVHILRSRFLWNDTCFERIAFRNYDAEAHRFLIEIHFDADFADLFEVRGQRRAHRGTRRSQVVECATVALGYEGLDGTARRTTLRFNPVPSELTTDVARFDIRLAGRGSAGLC